MFDYDALYKVLDSHFVNHLARPGEEEPAGEDTVEADGGELAPVDLPDNMLEDVLDELDGALEELHDEYGYSLEELTAAAIGFIDGVLAQSNGSYTSYEDAYIEDAGNGAYSVVDAAITSFAEEFDGNRDWGEAAKGYLRHVAKVDDGATSGVDGAMWQPQAQGFVYGADACEDYEWKVIQAPNDIIVITDEEAIEDFSMRQLEASGSGNLFDRVFNALGIDLDELKDAFGDDDDDDNDDEEEH